MLIAFEVLLYTYKLDWILSSSISSNTWLRFSKLTSPFFLLHFWFGITKSKDCPWICLEGTILGPPHHPDGSQASGTWILNAHLNSWKNLHLKSGPVQMLETSKSNWLGREIHQGRLFFPKHWIKSSYFN